MKVVCIDTDIRNKLGGSPTSPYLQLGALSEEQPLEYGKVYEGELIFNIDGKTEWKNNYLHLNGRSKDCFIKIEQPNKI